MSVSHARVLVIAALLGLPQGACGRAELPEEPAAGAGTAQGAASKSPASSTPAPAPPDEGNTQVIEARTAKGERTEVAVTAPPGFRVMAAPNAPDPHGGKFTLAEATKGLGKKGTLAARIDTAMGSFYCDLFEDRAPNTVANFVGLARGLRKYWDPHELAWVGKHYYDGTAFHRASPGFMIKGGDRTGFGGGVIGYNIPDELHPSLRHDRPGQLCMANTNQGGGAALFLITEVPAPHLDGGYPIFGQCEPATLVQRISRAPQKGKNEPLEPVAIRKVEIKRVVGGAAKWRPAGADVPPLPGLPAPGRGVMVP